MEDFSRREFLKKFAPKPQEQTKTSLAPEIENTKTEQATLSRRAFLKFLGAIGATIAMEQIGVKAVEAQGRKETAKTKQHNKEYSYKETAIEQSLMIVAECIAETIFEKLKIEYGNHTLSEEELIEYFRDKPIEGLLQAGALGPVIEEALFRALPSRIFTNKKDKRHKWEIGIPTSLLFAFAHNMRRKDLGKLEFVKSVPIAQFMAGLFWWYLMRKKGYSHAVMAHSINNTIPMSIGILLFKTYPEEKAIQIARKIF